MEIFNMYERPTAPLTAACAPLTAVRVAVAAARPSVPQVHQAELQAELILAPAPQWTQGISGFTGKGVNVAKRRMDVRGVPPRGRPV
ncbi:hypothetical protein [Micromonospora sp. NPDC049799]|uniref:hypothetical protein n=1 Tax=Micromonospora sp. NPDC049799 TaxID=3154741 RepID=UPI0033E7C39C